MVKVIEEDGVGLPRIIRTGKHIKSLQETLKRPTALHTVSANATDYMYLVFMYFIYSFKKRFTYVLCTQCSICVYACRLDLITDPCEPLSCACWELNSGPLEEQSVLLTTEPILQPCPVF